MASKDHKLVEFNDDYHGNLIGRGGPPLVWSPIKYFSSFSATKDEKYFSTNFEQVLHKVILCSKFVLVELTVCTTQLVRILHSMIFSRSQKLY